VDMNRSLRNLILGRIRDVSRDNVSSAVYLSFIDAALEFMDKPIQGGDGGRDSFRDLPQLFSRVVAEVLRDKYRCSDDSVLELLKSSKRWVDEVIDSIVGKAVLIYNIEALRRIIIHVTNPYMPLQIGVAWHPILNLPYIPSTSIKGVVRGYMEEYRQSVCGYSYRRLLGDRDREGILTFFDAVPISCRDRLIDVDIINPHYPEAEGIVDEVRVRPRPLIFPTIASGVRFAVVIGVGDGRLVSCRDLHDSLAKALEYGIGAKTMLGYGRVNASLASVRA